MAASSKADSITAAIITASEFDADEFDAALFAAAQAGRSGEIASLLEAASKESASKESASKESASKESASKESARVGEPRSILGDPLRVAVANNHVEAVQALFAGGSRGQVLEAILGPSSHRSALNTAARFGHADILQRLVQQCTPARLSRSDLTNHFGSAICDGRCDDGSFADVTRVLVAAKADPTSLLELAAASGTAPMISTLLEAKADIASDGTSASSFGSYLDPDGSLVHTALVYNRNACDVMTVLVRHKASVDAPYHKDRSWYAPAPRGVTPLCRASGSAAHLFESQFRDGDELQAHQLKCVATLLRLKADVHGCTQCAGATPPILEAAEHSGQAVVKALLSAKSRVQFGEKSALAVLLREEPAYRGAQFHSLVRHPGSPSARLLIRAKARVDDRIVRRACNWSRLAEPADAAAVLGAVYRAHPVPAQAQAVVLANLSSLQVLAGFVEKELGGDVSGVATAASGELVRRMCTKRKSCDSLRVLLEAKAQVEMRAEPGALTLLALGAETGSLTLLALGAETGALAPLALGALAHGAEPGAPLALGAETGALAHGAKPKIKMLAWAAGSNNVRTLQLLLDSHACADLPSLRQALDRAQVLRCGKSIEWVRAQIAQIAQDAHQLDTPLEGAKCKEGESAKGKEGESTKDKEGESAGFGAKDKEGESAGFGAKGKEGESAGFGAKGKEGAKCKEGAKSAGFGGDPDAAPLTKRMR